MHYFRVHLPRNNHWQDEYDSWLESSFTTGSAARDPEPDDFHGIIHAEHLDEIPVLIGGVTEGNEEDQNYI
jgi:hypothetical protein